MVHKRYIPHPIDTKDVLLSDELLDLGEMIARNVHEVWATGRIKDGWSYGMTRDDINKQHPCLIPYEDLPEQERDYDRDTALETLRLIVKLGFSIEKRHG